MAITIEREALLSDYLAGNVERTKELFNLMPEEALEKINADGNDFTLEEVKAYGENLQKLFERKGDGELNDTELDDVSGGALGTLAILAIYGATGAGGFGVGVCAYKGWW